MRKYFYFVVIHAIFLYGCVTNTHKNDGPYLSDDDIAAIETVLSIDVPETLQVRFLGSAFKEGSRGPAGGIVFFDRGFYDGWQYLEVAPFDQGVARWGQVGVNILETKMEIGTGKHNTELIITALGGESGTAAHLCREFHLNGYNDWFLPNDYELGLMYENLKKKGFGGFLNKYYWSSTQSNQDDAKYINFDTGISSPALKNEKMAVRAIRAF